MSDINTAPRGNSPAFPCQDNKKQIWTGMNLRDYFAMEAMNALIHDGVLDINNNGYNNIDDSPDLATCCYEIANAMLDEREKFR